MRWGIDRTSPLSSMRQLTNSPKIAAPVVSPVSVAPTICAALSSWTCHLLAHRDKEDWSSLNCELSCVTPLTILLKVAMTDPPPMAIMDTYTLREACHTVYIDGNMLQRREWREYSGTARFRIAMKRLVCLDNYYGRDYECSGVTTQPYRCIVVWRGG